jgi:hypothetical protein
VDVPVHAGQDDVVVEDDPLFGLRFVTRRRSRGERLRARRKERMLRLAGSVGRTGHGAIGAVPSPRRTGRPATGCCENGFLRMRKVEVLAINVKSVSAGARPCSAVARSLQYAPFFSYPTPILSYPDAEFLVPYAVFLVPRVRSTPNFSYPHAAFLVPWGHICPKSRFLKGGHPLGKYVTKL